MRIALCISGLARTYEKCLPTILTNIIDANPEHEFSTFIATWAERGMVDKTAPVTWAADVRDLAWINTSQIMQYPLNVKAIRVDTLQGSPFMTKILHDINTKYKDRKNAHQSNLRNLLPMLWKIDQCHALMHEYSQRDWAEPTFNCIIKARFDLFFTGPVKILEPASDELYMPNHERWGPGHLNDQFYYGGPQVMNDIHSVWRKLDGYYGAKQELHPETLYHDFIQAYGIRKVHRDMPYRIER